MPFQIIRDDITRVCADAIVDTANPETRWGAGTDAAIYRAAGEKELLAARKKIGKLAPGEAAVTPAFRLRAKYIIHTVGPAWQDGKHGETETLASCYRKSLALAEQLGCRSIAFPLVATGVYGFPKDLALETALSVIKDHLKNSDIEVILVVFERESLQIASGLETRIEAYIDEKYVARRTIEEYGGAPNTEAFARRRQQRRQNGSNYAESVPLVPGGPDETDSRGSARDERFRTKSLPRAAREPEELDGWDTASDESFLAEPFGAAFVRENDTAALPKKRKKRPGSSIGRQKSLEDAVNHLGESFQARLFRMIDERKMTDAAVYKRANIDRKLFSKIRCHEDYVPTKKTIVALAIALRLNLDETKDLLASAGLALTNNSKFDVIISFCIENGIYDIFEVNALLFRFEQPILG